jgi:hypothetical protein
MRSFSSEIAAKPNTYERLLDGVVFTFKPGSLLDVLIQKQKNAKVPERSVA